MPPCPGRACATTRPATSCATTCRWTMACCSTTPVALNRALPALRAWRAAHEPTRRSLTPPRRTHTPNPPADKPRLLLLDVQAQRKTRVVGLAQLREHPDLAQMRVLQRGNRLSITPVEPVEWAAIMEMLG